MILQNSSLPTPQRLSNLLPLLSIQHNPPKLSIHSMTLIKPQRILRNHIQFPPKRTECLPMHRVCMACSVNLGPSLMDLGVDGEGCAVYRLVSFDDLAFFVDEDQV